MAISSGMSGHSAVLLLENSPVGESTDFTPHFGQAVIDLTNRDANYWRQLISSTREWSISGVGNYYAGNLGKKVLVEHWENRTFPTITVVFTFADGAVTATGEAILTSLDFPSPHDGAATFTFTLEGTDALAISAS